MRKVFIIARLILVLIFWWISICVYVILFPVGVQNIQTFSGGPWVAVEPFCEEENARCVYVRTESPFGIDDPSIKTVWWTLEAAQRPYFMAFGVECDPGADIVLSWSRDVLVVTAEAGECRERGSKARVEPVKVVNS